MAWELEEAEPRECTLDDSGVYTVIHRIAPAETQIQFVDELVPVRVDVMTTDNKPIRSFVGNGNDVRKAVIAFLTGNKDEFASDENGYVSREHTSYIGYEIARAEADENYIQD